MRLVPSVSWRLRNTSGMRPRRGAEALGYPGQSPPARAIPDYFFKDHQPSARQGEARLRGRERNNYSKTISPRLGKAKPACAGESEVIVHRPSALGYAGQSPPARNANSNGDPLDHRLSAMQGKARLRGTRTPTATLSTIGYRLSTIGYRLCKAKPACVERELQRRPSRPSAIGYRLSVIDYRLSAIGYRRRSALSSGR